MNKSKDMLEKQQGLSTTTAQKFNSSIFEEKEHFLRLKEFEELCERNEEYRQRLGM